MRNIDRRSEDKRPPSDLVVRFIFSNTQRSALLVRSKYHRLFNNNGMDVIKSYHIQRRGKHGYLIYGQLSTPLPAV